MSVMRIVKQPDLVSRTFEVSLEDRPLWPRVEITVTTRGAHVCDTATEMVREAIASYTNHLLRSS